MTTSLDMIRGRSNVVTLTNNSGGALVAGDVCIQDATGNEYVTTTTSAASTKQVFIAAESIASAATGKFYASGYCPLVTPSASVTRGRYLFTHTVAKQAAENATHGAGAFGVILESGTTPSVWLFGETSQGSGGAGSDTTAIHDNVSGEISAVTEKVTPVDADLLLIEDSADSNNKKRVQIGNLPSGGSTVFNGGIIGTITTPPAAGWTWVNQGSATLTDGTTYQYLYSPSGTAGNNIRTVVRSFTPTARLSAIVQPFLPTGSFYRTGILVRNSSSGKIVYFGFASEAAQIWVERWTNATTWNATTASINLLNWITAAPFYIGCKVDGSNIYFQLSLIGDNTDANWQTFNTEALATFITSVDQVGFFCYANDATYNVGGALLHWNIY